MLLLLLLACSAQPPVDTSPVTDTSPPVHTGAVDSGPSPDGGSVDTAPPDLPEDLCDGLDDDDDGVIDDGFPDSDGDGRADCMQCAVEATDGELEAGETSCTVDWTPSDDPWDVELWWERDLPEGHTEDYGCTVTAAGDVDGDGVVEILCQGDLLYVVDGATGELQAEIEGFVWGSSHSLVDWNRDGFLDIAGVTPEGATLIVSSGGAVLQQSGLVLAPVNQGDYIQVDLQLVYDPDSETEIAVNHRGAQQVESGTLLGVYWSEDELGGFPPNFTAVADIDDDGSLEVYTYLASHDLDGTERWSFAEELDLSLPTAPVILGGSPPMIAWTLTQNWPMKVTPHDGTEALDVDSDRGIGGWNSGGCAADLVPGGSLEFVGARATALTDDDPVIVYASDGTEVWRSSVVREGSGGEMCVVVDLDGDGLPEVVLRDENGLAIFHGEDGERVFAASENRSATVGDLSIVVDLDGDGSVELVEPNIRPGGADPHVLRVYRHASGEWPPGAPFWASSSWSGTQLQTNGTIPRRPRKAWETTKLWRGMPTTWIAGGDLQVEVLDACAAEAAQLDPPSPEAEVRLAVRVVNLGPEEANTGVQLVVTGTDEDGGALTLASTSWDFLYTGEATATIEVVTTQAVADRGLHLRAEHLVDGALTVQDCDPGNHDWTWSLADL